METTIKYQSFNQNRTIEELQYNLILHRTNLRNTIKELEFYTFLVGASIYKSETINLFEKLALFKKEAIKIEDKGKILLTEVGMQLFQINKKLECGDLVCDQFFIHTIDQLEKDIHAFLYTLSDLKSKIFQYLQHVIPEK